MVLVERLGSPVLVRDNVSGTMLLSAATCGVRSTDTRMRSSSERQWSAPFVVVKSGSAPKVTVALPVVKELTEDAGVT